MRLVTAGSATASGPPGLISISYAPWQEAGWEAEQRPAGRLGGQRGVNRPHRTQPHSRDSVSPGESPGQADLQTQPHWAALARRYLKSSAPRGGRVRAPAPASPWTSGSRRPRTTPRSARSGRGSRQGSRGALDQPVEPAADFLAPGPPDLSAPRRGGRGSPLRPAVGQSRSRSSPDRQDGRSLGTARHDDPPQPDRRGPRLVASGRPRDRAREDHGSVLV